MTQPKFTAAEYLRRARLYRDKVRRYEGMDGRVIRAAMVRCQDNIDLASRVGGESAYVRKSCIAALEDVRKAANDQLDRLSDAYREMAKLATEILDWLDAERRRMNWMNFMAKKERP